MIDEILEIHEKKVIVDNEHYFIMIRHVKQKVYSEDVGYYVIAGHACNGRFAKFYSADYADVAGFILACEGAIGRYSENLKSGNTDLTTALLKEGFNKVELA